jgi:hypothetical protein
MFAIILPPNIFVFKYKYIMENDIVDIIAWYEKMLFTWGMSVWNL